MIDIWFILCFKQRKAKKMPAKYMSVITDGMDSSKTNIPHFKVKSKVRRSMDMFLLFYSPRKATTDRVRKLLKSGM